MRNPGVISLAGFLPLESQLSVIAKLTLMISMDSSNLHLASLLGGPLYLSGEQRILLLGLAEINSQPNMRFNSKCRAVRARFTEKEPCWRKDYACLEAIEPTMIVERVMKVLRTRLGAKFG